MNEKLVAYCPSFCNIFPCMSLLCSTQTFSTKCGFVWINTVCFRPFYRVMYPPVNPIGGSDLLPGPGAGMYPSRYVFLPVSLFLSSRHIYSNILSYLSSKLSPVENIFTYFQG